MSQAISPGVAAKYDIWWTDGLVCPSREPDSAGSPFGGTGDGRAESEEVSFAVGEVGFKSSKRPWAVRAV